MSWFKKGSRYTVGDLVYYTGLFFGIIVVFAIARPHRFHPVLVLLVGACIGVGLGYALERAYESARRNSDSGPDAERRQFHDDF
jgi:hypothetical protein